MSKKHILPISYLLIFLNKDDAISAHLIYDYSLRNLRSSDFLFYEAFKYLYSLGFKSFRFGADGASMGTGNAGTSIGLGFTWWTGGEGVKTSISTNYDMCMAVNNANAATNDNVLSVTVGFGF